MIPGCPLKILNNEFGLAHSGGPRATAGGVRGVGSLPSAPQGHRPQLSGEGVAGRRSGSVSI